MSFLQNILTGMKNILRSITKLVPGWVRRAMPAIYAVTTELRKLAESGADALDGDIAKLITAAIPGDADERMRVKMLGLLTTAIPKLIALEDCKGDADCMIRELLKWLAARTDGGRKGDLQKLSSFMLAAHDEDKLSESEYVKLATLSYKPID